MENPSNPNPEVILPEPSSGKSIHLIVAQRLHDQFSDLDVTHSHLLHRAAYPRAAKPQRRSET